METKTLKVISLLATEVDRLRETLKKQIDQLIDQTLDEYLTVQNVAQHIHDLPPEKREVKSDWKMATIPQPEEIIKAIDNILSTQKEKENIYYDSMGFIAPSEIVGIILPDTTLAGTNKDDGLSNVGDSI